MFIVLVITHTPTLRIVPVTTAGIAKQAAWLTPVISFLFLLPVIFALKSIFKVYNDKPFAGILEIIFGRFIGKIVTVFYIFFLFFLITLNTKSTSEQLVASIYTSVDPAIFIFVMLAIVALAVYKGGLTVITRMGEIILPYLAISFLILCSLSLQNIKLSRITPISYLDIVPVLKASVFATGVQSHLPMIFLLSNYINNKDKIGKYGIVTIVCFMILTVVLLITVIGALGAETTANAPFSFMAAVKLISLFESIERIEPLVVGMWILSDFMLLSVLLISLLNLFQSLFGLSKTKNFIIISLIVIFFLALMLGRNMFEVQRLAEVFLTPLMIFFGCALPIAVCITGKVRKLL
jgi:spore germination protein KB